MAETLTTEGYVGKLIEASSRLNKSVINTGMNVHEDNTSGASPSNTNFSPLSSAALMNDLDLVKALLEVGANPNYKNQGTQSPQDCAKNKPEIQNLLNSPQYQDPNTQQNRTLKAVMDFRAKERQNPSTSPKPTEISALQAENNRTQTPPH